jgi:hypothetical protein
MTRREFAAATGAALGAMFIPSTVLGQAGQTPPSEKVNIAIVGCGGQGMSDAAELVSGNQNIVALCDVDFGYVDRSLAGRTRGRQGGDPSPGQLKLKDAFTKAKRYADYRKMLDEQKDIDGVLIATPDHMHAIIAKAAMESGKHVYVEKPLTWSVNEARVLRETAARTKVVTQMGNMGHSSEGAAQICEWIQAGIIGPVHEVNVWTNRPIWPQGVPRPEKVEGDLGGWDSKRLSRVLAGAMAGGFPVPQGLDWDLYLGPAPAVPYHPVYHPFNWRGWVDWGCGALGDMGAHLIDHPYWALNLRYPTSIEATSTPWGTDADYNLASFPLGMQVTYHFAARGNQPPVKMTWCDGGLMPGRPDMLPNDVQLDRGGGAVLIGEKGILLHETYGSNPRIFPATLMDAAQKVPKTFPRYNTGHRMQWAQAIKGVGKTSCPIDYASRLTETMLLGIVALRTGQGRRIEWDGEAGKVTNVSNANDYLAREYRKGWTL